MIDEVEEFIGEGTLPKDVPTDTFMLFCQDDTFGALMNLCLKNDEKNVVYNSDIDIIRCKPKFFNPVDMTCEGDYVYLSQKTSNVYIEDDNHLVQDGECYKYLVCKKDNVVEGVKEICHLK